MKITVTEKALQWFQNELVIDAGQGVRFFGKVYGSTNVHEGFSVGLMIEMPEAPIYQEVIAGLLFFIEAADEWFFQGYQIAVDYDETLAEPKYTFFTE
ncbi:uncharacterized protein YneR [Enterococcus sp. PF1-24]|uniref:HesB/YadR/YfhF family protein n=1 Tax=unclassified Enterococcus TaxID=2608891 RepID=UPI002474FE33|nr:MULTISPECIES: iron-sulfur cluster biosynthesis protein [unclassified Enterococcus]MDH6363611.1 uncharacterized protein YneR [Enterococcus sp. PFB1-1]MDH6400846.1 uncharacterized protein YneR [Enterococcus sp. PF1-24]